MIQMAMSPKFPKFCCQGRLEEVVRCELRRASLDSRTLSMQSRIGLFEAEKNIRQTVSVIYLQFGEHLPPCSREI
jgi:hypothetical protein